MKNFCTSKMVANQKKVVFLLLSTLKLAQMIFGAATPFQKFLLTSVNIK